MSDNHRENRPAATFLDMADSGGDTRTFPPVSSDASAGADGNPAARTENALKPGAQLGRYVIVEVLGKGGMGVVYKAVDPDLGRWVAIKLVRVRTSSKRRRESLEDARARLLREAQALAKLTHPNVVTVHDVGRFEDDIFIAMEFVEGVTLRRWLEQESRSITDIVHVMTAAGDGLAAAHAAGLVHRDFKPANVMIGPDQRVWVLDFGLVRTSDVDTFSTSLLSTSPGDGSAGASTSMVHEELSRHDFPDSLDLSEALTRQGAIVGTPAYMAPEQYAGSGVDRRTDLFSFCVVLYEALYGVRPYRSKRVARLRKDIQAGNIGDPPTDRSVPAWLEAIWRRGLSPDPDDRYPSMGALLAELSRDRQRQRRRLLGLAAIVALMAMAAIAGSLLWRDQPAPVLCQGARAQIGDVWNEGLRSATEQNFLATGRSYAADTFKRLRAQLDRYTDDWVDMHTRACRATRVTGEQSEILLDVRMRCLARQRTKLAALTESFATRTDPTIVDKSIAAVSELPAVERCADLDALTAQAPLPEDESKRAAVAQLRGRIDRLRSVRVTGEFKAGLQEARAISAEARSLDYPPIAAESSYEVGVLQYLAGDHRGSETVLKEAARDTATAKDDRLFAIIQTRLLGLLGERQAHGREADMARWVAENAVARAGAAPALRAELAARLGDMAWSQGRYEQAIARHEQALAIHRDELADSDALAVAGSYWSLARIYWVRGENAEAREFIQRSLAIYQRALGPKHPDVGKLWGNIGTILVGERQFDDARTYLQRALEITERALGPEHPDVAGLLNNLGDVVSNFGQYEQARSHFERARALLTRVHGGDHPNVGVCWQNLAEMERRQGRHEESLPLYDKAMAIFLEALGDGHPFLAFPLTGKGAALVELGRYESATTALTRALALRQANPGADTDLARSSFTLARALWPTPAPRPNIDRQRRAHELADAALQKYVAAGAPFAAEVTEIRAWTNARAQR